MDPRRACTLEDRRIHRSRTSTLDKEQLQGLRDELAQALDTVERMQLRRAAEEAVQSEHPHFCCPVELVSSSSCKTLLRLMMDLRA